MHLRIPLLLLVALGSTVQAEEVWKWVDSQGVTHYADRPVPGAVRVDIKVQSVPTSEAEVVPTTGAATTRPATPAQPPYAELEIWKPASEESVVNTGGLVQVRMRLEPAIRPRHTLALYLDGKRVESLAPGALQVDLQDVPRGTHSLVASVFDDAGKLVQQGQQVVFFVRQESVAQPPVGPMLRPPPKP
ncbi:MAG: DUF4124 domain-containing protein [Steroidobacteraceae bacterium]